MVGTIFRGLRSVRLTLSLLLFIAAFCGLATWLGGNQTSVPDGRNPFSSWPFLVACGLLFLNTATCTAYRARRLAAVWRGVVPPAAATLPRRGNANLAQFLTERHGFRAHGAALFRNRPALFGGVVFHAGLLVLMAATGMQQAFHDTGAFEVAEGETLDLRAPRAVFARARGLLAPAAPPALRVTLLAFDPFLHQLGFAADRGSRVLLERPGMATAEAFVDRAHGVQTRAATIFQAIPTGLALVVDVPGLGVRALHLRARSRFAASATFTAPGGAAVRLGVRGERRLDDATGTGALSIWEEHEGVVTDLRPGSFFQFGTVQARLVQVSRWAGFTFSRSPGMTAVYAGFALVLLGATLLLFPAGVACIAGEGAEMAGRVWVNRGNEALLAEWDECSDNRDAEPGGKA